MIFHVSFCCKVIAENCPNLSQLWLRCNHFTNPDLSNAPEFSPTIEHSHLKKLAVLYLRVGENNYNTCKLQPYVFHYLLRNAGEALRADFGPSDDAASLAGVLRDRAGDPLRLVGRGAGQGERGNRGKVARPARRGASSGL